MVPSPLAPRHLNDTVRAWYMSQTYLGHVTVYFTFSVIKPFEPCNPPAAALVFGGARARCRVPTWVEQKIILF